MHTEFPVQWRDTYCNLFGENVINVRRYSRGDLGTLLNTENSENHWQQLPDNIMSAHSAPQKTPISQRSFFFTFSTFWRDRRWRGEFCQTNKTFLNVFRSIRVHQERMCNGKRAQRTWHTLQEVVTGCYWGETSAFLIGQSLFYVCTHREND